MGHVFRRAVLMAEQIPMARLTLGRDDFSDIAVERVGEVAPAGPGEVVMRIDLFSLTTNNITYAVYGEVLKYWQFFPVDDKRGLLPVWGYAEVQDSTVAGIEPGQRWFGYYPLATHLVVRPGKAGSAAFRDDSPHRRELPEVYNWYQRTDNDPRHSSAVEPLHAIYRPLFVTAWCLADFLHERQTFGARRVIISSASSKTGYATAFCVRKAASVELTGLTSPGNRAFVEQLGLYDSVLGYDQLDLLDDGVPTVYIDIAGNPALQRRLHDHLGDQLRYDCAVGSAQSLKPPEPQPDLAGPRPEFFFAPSWIAKRQRDWGTAGFEQRVGEATEAFYQFVGKRSEALELIEHQGLDAARRVVAELVAGRVDPRAGHIVRLT